MNESSLIRAAREGDVPVILELIRHLAAYERAPDEVKTTEAQLLEDGFGEDAVYDCFVAEFEGQVCGMALFYPVYSTWRGRSLYLEDLVVFDQYRGKGMGMALMKRLAEEALRRNCRQMMWQVLDWNEPAIRFYDRIGTELDREWIDCDLNVEALKRLANG